jgi:methionyl-tRNA formyltransferase
MRIIFIGTGEIGVPTLKALIDSEHKVVGVVTQPDKPVGREQQIEAPPIKKALLSGAAGGRALPFSILQPAKIKDPKVIEEIRELKPDVIVVMAYGQILSRDVLEIPDIACLNLHASILPRWRGAAPIQAAIAAGDRETGITVMYMDQGLDTGDIQLQRTTEVLPADTGGSLHDRLAQIAPDVLLESLRLLATGNAQRIPQENALATYAPKLKREHGRIDWSESAEAIERKIRAFNPWPCAFTNLGGENLKIFSGAVIDVSGTPGEILRCENELVIGAGKGAISVDEVQLEGKRRMHAEEFLRGHASLVRGAS